MHEWLLLTLLLDLHILGMILLLHLLHLFAIYITSFPAIRRRTSPAPVGCTPEFLFSGINRLAVEASKLLSVSEFERYIFVFHNRFTKFAMDVRSSKGREPNWVETKILCSYYWLISAVHHLHYFFASGAWILIIFSIFIWLFVDGNLSWWFYFRSQVRWCFLPTISVFFFLSNGGLLPSTFYLVFVGVVRA